MRRVLLLLFSGVLFAGLLPRSHAVGRISGIAVFVIAIGLFVIVWLVHQRNTGLKIRVSRHPRYIELSIIAIVLAYILSVIILRYEPPTKPVSPIFRITLFLIAIYVIPAAIEPQDYLFAISRFSAVLVAIPIVAFPLGLLSPSILETFWRPGALERHIGIVGPTLNSITSNPNILGRILFIGSIAAYAQYQRSKDPRELLLFASILLGLGLTANRSGWLALGAAAFVYFWLHKRGEKVGKTAFLVVVAGCVSLFLAVVTLHEIGQPMDLSGRGFLWPAAFRAVLSQPLFGYGFIPTPELIEPFLTNPSYRNRTPHNAFLILSLYHGVIGGIAYFTLVIGSTIRNLSYPTPNPFFVSIGAGIVVTHMFGSATAFGYGIIALLYATTIGYLLRHPNLGSDEQV